jgi:hypothetical protein
MDDQRFDALTRRLAMSRRHAIRGLIAGAMSPVLTGRGQDATAACGVVGERCQFKTDCCAGSRCDNDRCRCRDGLTACGKRCRDLESDRAHCGACGNACRSGQTCCGGTCADLETDADHCGECGRRCHQICNEMKDGTVMCVGERCCDGGQCVVDTTSNPEHCGACHRACAAGETCCGSECIDLQADGNHCGGCFQECPGFMTCLAGQCVVT